MDRLKRLKTWVQICAKLCLEGPRAIKKADSTGQGKLDCRARREGCQEEQRVLKRGEVRGLF